MPPSPPRNAHQEYLQRRTFGSLDGIRCASILAVIFHHGPGGLEFGRISLRGFLGVDMFFVLSGFLIVTLLLREQDRHAGISLKAFYARRTLRIMPLYYGVVLLFAVLFGWLRPQGDTAQHVAHDLPYLLTYTSNWAEIGSMMGITWSLAAEEQFYALWPPLQKYFRSTLLLAFVLVGVSQLVHLGVIDNALYSWFGWSPKDPPMLRQTTFTPILLGVILAHVLHSPKGFSAFNKLFGSKIAPLVGAASIVAMCQLMPLDIQGWPRLAIHGLMFIFLGSCVVGGDHVLTPLVQSKPVVRIGVLSYGMYLWHMFVLNGVDRAIDAGLPKVAQFPALLAGTWVIAELSYRFYEQPFLRLKHRFAR